MPFFGLISGSASAPSVLPLSRMQGDVGGQTIQTPCRANHAVGYGTRRCHRQRSDNRRRLGPVGYMYRTRPHDELDSGWAFLAGDEEEAYMDDPNNLEIYDVNTIANYDPKIIPLLDAPVGSAFIRTASGLEPDPQGAPPE